MIIVRRNPLTFSVNKSSKHSLIKSTFAALKWPILAPALPRLCLIGFDYAQPFLINRTVDFVGEPITPQNKNIGYGLIGAAAITYIGRAVRNKILPQSIHLLTVHR